MDKSNLTIIIPCYKPDIRLVELLKNLIQRGFKKFILTDDGSGGGVFSNIL